jgi:hypothetical protein
LLIQGFFIGASVRPGLRGCRRDKDFAINGLAHGLVGKDPKTALKWANSISNEGFRKVVVENVTRRIDAR